MSPFAPPEARAPRSLIAWVREDWGRKATGAAVALALELLLILVLIALGVSSRPREEVPLAPVTFDASEDSKEPAPEPKAAAAPTRRQATAPQPQPAPPSVTPPTPPPAAILPVSPQQMQSFDISKLAKPAAPKAPAYGPAFSPAFGDSERVGIAPNGQAMYDARWVRKPTRQEKDGYLATADGPGWAEIACKTVPDLRVDDCVGIDESPEGSHIMRSLLAMAWQFHVRPPQVGGVLKYGAWVRIHLDYGDERPRPYGDAAGN